MKTKSKEMENIILGIKWKKERSYSEQEVFKFLQDALNNYDLRNNRISLTDWFNQYKK